MRNSSGVYFISLNCDLKMTLTSVNNLTALKQQDDSGEEVGGSTERSKTGPLLAFVGI